MDESHSDYAADIKGEFHPQIRWHLIPSASLHLYVEAPECSLPANTVASILLASFLDCFFLLSQHAAPGEKLEFWSNNTRINFLGETDLRHSPRILLRGLLTSTAATIEMVPIISSTGVSAWTVICNGGKKQIKKKQTITSCAIEVTLYKLLL